MSEREDLLIDAPGSAEDALLACVHADRCGGCPAITLPYAAQCAQKEARTKAAVARYDALDVVAVGACEPADLVQGYRTRVKLVVEGGRVGLYARGSHEVVDIPECRVMAPSLLRVAESVRALGSASLRAVDLRECLGPRGDAVVLATLVTSEGTRAEPLADALHALDPSIAGIAVSTRASDAVRVLGGAPRVVLGHESAPDVVLGGARPVWIEGAHGGFVQAHRGQAEKLVRRVLGALGGALGGLRGARVVDAFAGSGAFGLALAAEGAEVLLVESFEPAVRGARGCAEDQGLHVHAHPGDCSDTLAQLAEARARVDAVVLDPPRRGLPPELREALARLAPRVIAYVSCEPETLARDLAHLGRLGYAADAIETFDLMPQTGEVECFALLHRAAPRPVRVLYADAELVAVDKPPYLPTTPQGEHERALLDDVRALPGCADAVPIHRLDEGTSGVCLFARAPAFVSAFAAALSAGEKRYTCLARGIARDKGTIRRALLEEGRDVPAVTRYRRTRVVGSHSLLAVRIETGRTHQIRRHLAGLSHPVIGDARHGDPRTNRHFFEKLGLDRPFLHCAEVSITHPTTQAPLVIESPLPGDLRAVLDQLAR